MYFYSIRPRHVYISSTFLVLFLISACADIAATTSSNKPLICSGNPYKQASAELAQMAVEDQSDRTEDQNNIDWEKVSDRDRERRQKTQSLLDRGCVQSAKDYDNVALIFQHGITIEDYYQAYILSKKSGDLGNLDGYSLMALAIDRYLLNQGYAQLYGSQAVPIKETLGSNEILFCLWPVWPDFPEEKRQAVGISLAEKEAWLMRLNNQADNTKHIYCDVPVKMPPKGIFENIW